MNERARDLGYERNIGWLPMRLRKHRRDGAGSHLNERVEARIVRRATISNEPKDVAPLDGGSLAANLQVRDDEQVALLERVGAPTQGTKSGIRGVIPDCLGEPKPVVVGDPFDVVACFESVLLHVRDKIYVTLAEVPGNRRSRRRGCNDHSPLIRPSARALPRAI